MKNIVIILNIAAVLILSACASSKTSVNERIIEAKGFVEKKDYVISVDYAQPMRGGLVHLNGNYDLTVRNDSAIAYLPYFGEVQSLPLDMSDGGIKFAEPMINYQVTPKKKGGGYDVTFKVNAREYRYDFLLSIFDKGASSIIVNSVQRDQITFSGTLKE